MRLWDRIPGTDKQSKISEYIKRHHPFSTHIAKRYICLSFLNVCLATMEGILQNLQHEVTCTICQETFRTPKTLPCLHTFCCECLNEHLRYRKRANLPINCPICNAVIQATNRDNFDHLPTSFYHNRLLDTLSIKQCSAGSDVTCGNCKKLTSESSYCFECAKFLCTDCFNAHNLLGYLNENHRVVEVRKFRQQDYQALLQRQPFCQQ